MSAAAAVKVSRRGADRWASGHPWIFAGDVVDRGEAAPGAAVRVVDQRGRFLGVAHYSSQSQIALRLLARQPVEVDREFFAGRLEQAEAYRRRVVSDSDAYRAVHGEADGLPALIVDRYADWLVVQALDQGMDRASGWIVEALETLYRPRGILLRNDAAVRAKEGLAREKRVASGTVPETVEVRMNGWTLEADLAGGQKTGIYLDQRENYLAVAAQARGRALDCFTSTGGFALHMAGRCESVEAVDSSAAALETARRNQARNGVAGIQWREADVFELLAGYSRARAAFDTIVLDPPAFAKSRGEIEGALRAYREINLRALRILAPDGVLVSCSCSHHVSEAALLGVLAEAALEAGRTLRVRERRTQAADHPVLLTVPETHYLKCLIVEAVG